MSAMYRVCQDYSAAMAGTVALFLYGVLTILIVMLIIYLLLYYFLCYIFFLVIYGFTYSFDIYVLLSLSCIFMLLFFSPSIFSISFLFIIVIYIYIYIRLSFPIIFQYYYCYLFLFCFFALFLILFFLGSTTFSCFASSWNEGLGASNAWMKAIHSQRGLRRRHSGGSFSPPLPIYHSFFCFFVSLSSRRSSIKSARKQLPNHNFGPLSLIPIDIFVERKKASRTFLISPGNPLNRFALGTSTPHFCSLRHSFTSYSFPFPQRTEAYRVYQVLGDTHLIWLLCWRIPCFFFFFFGFPFWPSTPTHPQPSSTSSTPADQWPRRRVVLCFPFGEGGTRS
eukprot:gene1644-1012_t